MIVHVLKIIFVGNLLVLFALPLAQMKFDFIETVGLNNVRIPRKPPEFSWQSLTDGSFQKSLDNWFKRNTGLWGILVRTENQINYSLFKLASVSYRSTVVMGNDAALFQRLYVDDLNRRRRFAPFALERHVRKMKLLQDHLAENNKLFLYLITPNKVSVHPELLPDSYRVPETAGKKRNYDHMLALLEKHGVNYLDAHQLVIDRAPDFEYPLFSYAGSHWNSIGTCVVGREISLRLARQLGRPLRSMACDGEITVRQKPRAEDRDLAKMLNIWNSSASWGLTPYLMPRADSVTNRSQTC